MKTYILDIIPKIQRFSQKLDNFTILLNKHWVILDEETSMKSVFIFREKDNQLLISTDGKIEKGKWEYLGNNSLLIDRKDGAFLFKHGFIDDNVLALKVDGKEEYTLLVNEQWFENQMNNLAEILSFLNKEYLVGKGEPKKLSYTDEDLINDIKKRIDECIAENFKDFTFLRGIMLTLSLRTNCISIIEKYKIKYRLDICEEIKSNCVKNKSANYILEPLIKKGITQKK
jgi:hypothetical protein